MKLKKSFSVSFLLILIIVFSSCVSNFSLVPGESSAKISNIYTEYYNLAESYFKLEDYTNASKYYSLAMNNYKNYWASYYKLAKCYVYLSDWNNAMPMYKKLLKRDSENTALKASLAYIYLMQGDFKNARNSYLELLEIEETNKDYLENYLALLLSDEKYYKKYSDEYEKYFAILNENYPDNDNTKKIKEKYEQLNPSEETDEVENSDENETTSEDSELNEEKIVENEEVTESE